MCTCSISLQAVEKGCKKFVCASGIIKSSPKLKLLSLILGGNAGLAATCAAMKLNRPITVYVPETTSEVMREKLLSEGAFVQVHGKV